MQFSNKQLVLTECLCTHRIKNKSSRPLKSISKKEGNAQYSRLYFKRSPVCIGKLLCINSSMGCCYIANNL